MTNPTRSTRTPPPATQRSRRFALGLLAYLVLTVLVFAVVQRYAVHIVRLYGYNIKSVALQWTLYCAILAGATAAALTAARFFPIRVSPENRLRVAFAAGATLSLVAALYQSRFGVDKLVNYFVVGTLAAFATSLIATRHRFGLIEVIAKPSADLVREVERGHAGVAPAATTWDHGKRSIEFVLSLLVIAVSLPISVPLAVLVWLQDPGPLLVAKVAVMRAGRSFHQFKLRTMVKNAEVLTGPVPAEPMDVRVTRLGSILRSTHIDELPQMLNIARGEMSFVGPRPERTVFVARHLKHVSGYADRHAVRPGLAGLAQVYGDYYSTPAQKLRYDLIYIRRRSFGLDARLFGAAVLMALFGVPPGGRRRRRLNGRRRYDRARWRRAYAALRGEPAPNDREDDREDSSV